MAFQRIRIKNSNVVGKIPGADKLDTAELCINLKDQKLYSKDADGNVFEIGKGSIGNGNTPPGTGNEIGDLWWDGDILLIWNGTDWEPVAPVTSVNGKVGDVVLELGDLDNVAVDGVVDEQVLVYDATAGKWVPASAASLAVDVDLDYTPASNKGTVTNSAGDDAEIPLVNATNAGLMSPADYEKLAAMPGIISGPTPPGSPSNGDIWIDTNDCPPTINIWDDCDDPGNPTWKPIGGGGGGDCVQGPVQITSSNGTELNSTLTAVGGNGVDDSATLNATYEWTGAKTGSGSSIVADVEGNYTVTATITCVDGSTLRSSAVWTISDSYVDMVNNTPPVIAVVGGGVDEAYEGNSIYVVTNATVLNGELPSIIETQWFKDGVADGTGSIYTIGAGDETKVITAKQLFRDLRNNELLSLASNAITIVERPADAITFTAVITDDGTSTGNTPGHVLTASATNIIGGTAPTEYAYQWKSGGVATVTTKTYTLVEGDVGKIITCDVTVAEPDGSNPEIRTATYAKTIAADQYTPPVHREPSHGETGIDPATGTLLWDNGLKNGSEGPKLSGGVKVEIATDSAFSQKYKFRTFGGSVTTVDARFINGSDLTTNTNYYWKVTNIWEDGHEETAAPWRFVTGVTGTINKPTVLAPADGAGSGDAQYFISDAITDVEDVGGGQTKLTVAGPKDLADMTGSTIMTDGSTEADGKYTQTPYKLTTSDITNVSADQDAEWEDISNALAQGYAIAYSPTLKRVIVGDSPGRLFVADDPGTWSWTEQNVPTSTAPDDLIWCGGTINKFIWLGTSILASDNGIDWTESLGSTSTLVSLVFAEDTIIAVGGGSSRNVMTSTDGIGWSSQTAGIAGNPAFADVAYSPSQNRLVAVAYNVNDGGSTVFYSDNKGANWTRATQVPFNTNCVAYSPTLNRFVALSGTDDANGMYSTDGDTWTAFSTPRVQRYVTVTWNEFANEFLATGYTNPISEGAVFAFSTDGINWDASNPTPGSATQWYQSMAIEGKWVAVGTYGVSNVVEAEFASKTTELTFADPNPDLRYFAAGDEVQPGVKVISNGYDLNPKENKLFVDGGEWAGADGPTQTRPLMYQTTGVPNDDSNLFLRSNRSKAEGGVYDDTLVDTWTADGPGVLSLFFQNNAANGAAPAISTFNFSSSDGVTCSEGSTWDLASSGGLTITFTFPSAGSFEIEYFVADASPFNNHIIYYYDFAGGKQSTWTADGQAAVILDGDTNVQVVKADPNAQSHVEYQTNGGEGEIVSVNTNDNTLLLTNTGDRNNRWIIGATDASSNAGNSGETGDAANAEDFYVAGPVLFDDPLLTADVQLESSLFATTPDGADTLKNIVWELNGATQDAGLTNPYKPSGLALNTDLHGAGEASGQQPPRLRVVNLHHVHHRCKPQPATTYYQGPHRRTDQPDRGSRRQLGLLVDDPH